jgi:KUP system potassium uptake protein
MAATGISGSAAAGSSDYAHATPTSFWALTLGTIGVVFGFMEHPNLPRALEAANFDLSNASFFLSRRALQASSTAGLPLWQDYLFIPMARSASDVTDQFCIPEDQAVEVGSRITI